MPFPNEHAARLLSPDKFIRFRRQNDRGGTGIDFIFGITTDGKTEVQAIRFDKKEFTVDQAKTWLTEHNHKAILFEAASGGENLSEYSALEEFFPVAVTGKYPQGNLSEGIFDEIVSTFSPVKHEPPVTIGHINQSHADKPAAAWISGVKRVGKVLFAKCKQVWKTFDEEVQSGRYKKRSIGLRRNAAGKLYLHHLAFLGAMPPACEGMPNIYDLGIYEGMNADGENVFDYDDNKTNPNPKQRSGPVKEYSDLELEKIKDDAVAAAAKKTKDDIQEDYDEKLKKEKEDAEKVGKDKAEKEYNEKREKDKDVINHEAKIDEFCDAGIKDGSITPAMIEAGLKQLLYSMVEPIEIEYSQKDKAGKESTVKTNNIDIVKAVIKAYAKVTEGSTKDVDGDGTGGDYAAEKKLAEEKMSKNDKLTFSQALLDARAELKTKKDD